MHAFTTSEDTNSLCTYNPHCVLDKKRWKVKLLSLHNNGNGSKGFTLIHMYRKLNNFEWIPHLKSTT